VYAELAGAMQKCAKHQHYSPNHTHTFEAGKSASLDQAVKLEQPKHSQQRDYDKEKVVRDNSVARKHRAEHNRPQHNKTRQATQKYRSAPGRHCIFLGRPGYTRQDFRRVIHSFATGFFFRPES